LFFRRISTETPRPTRALLLGASPRSMTQSKAKLAAVTVRGPTSKSTAPREAAEEEHRSSNGREHAVACQVETGTAAAANTSVALTPTARAAKTASMWSETEPTKAVTPAAKLDLAAAAVAAATKTGVETGLDVASAVVCATDVADQAKSVARSARTHAAAGGAAGAAMATAPTPTGTAVLPAIRAHGNEDLLRSKRNSSSSAGDESREVSNRKSDSGSGGTCGSGGQDRPLAAAGGIGGEKKQSKEEELLLQTGSAWKSSDSIASGLWLHEENDDSSEERSVRHQGGTDMVQSLQSMLLTSEQNDIMRLPNYGCFMHQQENLQALLVDIHEDPEGFKEFVETRRKGIGDLKDHLGEAMASALTSGGESLSDYTNLTEIGKGRFSVVFYAECKTTRRPCAIKRIQLANPGGAGNKGNKATSRDKGSRGTDKIDAVGSSSNNKGNDGIPRQDRLELRGTAPAAPPVAPAPSPQAADLTPATATKATSPVPQITLVPSSSPATAATTPPPVAATTITRSGKQRISDGEGSKMMKPEKGSKSKSGGAPGNRGAGG
ncbi:unnamed protein product, partial [Scytosiphon promiscuus]